MFWTHEHHTKYHIHSDETKKKISDSHKRYDSDEYRQKISKANKSYWNSPESDNAKTAISNNSKARWQDENYRKAVTHKIAEARQSEESRRKTSQITKRIMTNKSKLYKEYRSNGGTLLWNDFQKALSLNLLESIDYPKK